MSQLNPLIMPDWLTSLWLMLISPAERTASHTVKMPKWAHTTIRRDYNLHTWQILLSQAVSGAVNVAYCCHTTRSAIEDLEGVVKMPSECAKHTQLNYICLSRKDFKCVGVFQWGDWHVPVFFFNTEQLKKKERKKESSGSLLPANNASGLPGWVVCVPWSVFVFLKSIYLCTLSLSLSFCRRQWAGVCGGTNLPCLALPCVGLRRHPNSPVIDTPSYPRPILGEAAHRQLEEKRIFLHVGKLEGLRLLGWQKNDSKETLQCLRLCIIFQLFSSWSIQQGLSGRQSDHGSGSAFPGHHSHSLWAVWFDTWQQSNNRDQTSLTHGNVTSNVYWHSKVHSGNMSGWAGTSLPCSARDSLNHRLQLPTKIKPKFK